jgi:sugar phosphate isomerase/epimerase
MKLGCCCGFALGRYGRAAGVEQLLRAMGEQGRLGLRRVELPMIGRRAVRRIAEAKERFCFAVDRGELDLFSVCVALEGLEADDEAVRERAFEDFDLAVRTAEALGATFVRLGRTREEPAEPLMVCAAAALAARSGKTLLIDPPGPCGEAAAAEPLARAAAGLIEAAGEPNVLAVLDTADLADRRESLDASLETLGGRVGLLRLADSNGRPGRHLAPGAGRIDWLATFTALAQHRYTGYVGLEIDATDPDAVCSDYAAGAAHLRSTAERGGFLLE